MADYDNRVIRGSSAAAGAIDAGLRSYMLRIYNYMLIGLVLTGVTAWAVANIPEIGAIFFRENMQTGRIGLTGLGWIALLAPLGMVMALSFGIQRVSLGAAQLVFWGYAALVGISLAPLLWVYTGTSVAQVFFITAATFGAMSLYGYSTRRDLSGLGSFLFMGLIGIIIASVVNIFLASGMMSWVISVIGVLVFTGLTAYDTQWIKESYVASDDGSLAGRKAIYGALKLYLDFINLFVMLLRILGVANRR
ncbi:MAG: Bax inhibitor-1/YccA family protein [Alphaproteobacteria bacterium]|nr:Bax inhibitor-1/YccA family protein [Alphaproteobacteria bacterium]